MITVPVICNYVVHVCNQGSENNRKYQKKDSIAEKS
jgi:hypothetical protein